MSTFANSEDPNDMPHFTAFHPGLHCLLRQNCSSGKEMQYILEIITCDLSLYMMDHPDFNCMCIKLYGKFHWSKKVFFIPAFFFRKKRYINFMSNSVRCLSVTFLVNVSPPKPLEVAATSNFVGE